MYDLKSIALFFVIGFFVLCVIFYKKPDTNLYIDEIHDVDPDAKKQSLEDYWQNYEPKNSLFSILLNVLVILVAPVLFVYGYFYNQQIHLYSKYFLIFAECISCLFLLLIPPEVITKILSDFKITTILSIISTIFVLIAALIFGDLFFASILFFGTLYFLNKVFS